MAEHVDSSGVSSAPLLEIGRVGRPHGTGGEVTVTLVSNRSERLEPGSELQTDLGILQVSSARPHNQRHLVRFAGIDDRSKAEALRGLLLRAAPIVDPDELWVHELVGARVVDQSGTDRGVVASVVANPAGDLLELTDGVLVPLRFLVRSVPSERIEVEVPDGLFETT
ncbi:MAG: 16S rRNA processing protein RimM [Acidimicrobiaceae bacterium]|nr:16S rRNA processing protein RimM [Acidimicrobiaceae bacterium]MXZ99595.1 16S rRNA processing protein RimM [Acidimicrobiaceae bacterium]MYE75533.1 16S rRNA processing protein RimM [Acidimicrobiaceae bacterium]MYE95769.1 16S rRNA processing protein RimM [Acidimicrobiaceae bacterium]MYH43932.1 16S rRNA processing protein RimM [Acidimicrobiaceae bacterium]